MPGLLFVGTEFSFYFTMDSGETWTEMNAGLPPISVKDMAIQERENDIVLATFGRGFYILDDYTPLREMARNPDIRERDAHIFPVADALMYIPARGKNRQGSSFYKSENPEFGATFTYYLKEVPQTLKQERREEEKALFENREPIPQLSRDQLRKEEAEEDPYLVFAIRDESGEGIRKLYKKASAGLSRITWDLRYASSDPVSASVPRRGDTSSGDGVSSSEPGLLIMPGTYSMELYMVARGEVTGLVDPVTFQTRLLSHATLPVKDHEGLVAFQRAVDCFVHAVCSRIER